MLRNLVFYSIVLTACAQDHNEGLGVSAAADGGVSDSDSCELGTSQFPRTYPEDGPCDDKEPVHSASWAGHRGAYVLTCDSAKPAASGCKGIPNDIWGRCSLRRCESKEIYPQGCTVFLPTENPYYVGSPQSCSCQAVPGTSTGPQWACGL